MTQLASITLSTGCFLETYWNVKTREVSYELLTNRAQRLSWGTMPDGPIGESCASFLGIPLNTLQVAKLRVFEGRHPVQSVYDADTKMLEDFLTCDWSDYATSDMAVQCDFSY